MRHAPEARLRSREVYAVEHAQPLNLLDQRIIVRRIVHHNCKDLVAISNQCIWTDGLPQRVSLTRPMSPYISMVFQTISAMFSPLCAPIISLKSMRSSSLSGISYKWSHSNEDQLTEPAVIRYIAHDDGQEGQVVAGCPCVEGQRHLVAVERLRRDGKEQAICGA